MYDDIKTLAERISDLEDKVGGTIQFPESLEDRIDDLEGSLQDLECNVSNDVEYDVARLFRVVEILLDRAVINHPPLHAEPDIQEAKDIIAVYKHEQEKDEEFLERFGLTS